MKKLSVGLKRSAIGLVCLMLGGFGTAFAQEADVPMAEGVLWIASSNVEKTAYLVGAGNMMEVEYVVQQQSENPGAFEDSSIQRYWDGVADESLDDMIAAIDSFYADNPDQMTVPVLMVIWNTFVETD